MAVYCEEVEMVSVVASEQGKRKMQTYTSVFKGRRLTMLRIGKLAMRERSEG